MQPRTRIPSLLLVSLAALPAAAGAQAPDLVPVSATVSDDLLPFGTVTLDVGIENQGADPSTATTGAWYVSPDATVTTDDYLLHRFAIPALASGASTTVSSGAIPVPSTIPEGTCWVGALLDDKDLVTEADETNNGSTPEQKTCESRVDAASLGISIITPNFGFSVSAGDFDGDGYTDLGVSGKGQNLVINGKDGTSLRFAVSATGDLEVIGAAGDVNGDGTDEFLLALPSQQNGQGRVTVQGQFFVLGFLSGDAPGDYFGTSVSGAGDLNRDGYDDFVVGARAGGNNGGGYARAFSGVDLSEIYTWHGDAPGDRFGHTVTGGGDLDDDGHPDVIVGAPQLATGGGRGYARAFSGKNGSTLFTWRGDAAGDQFGWAVSHAGDPNDDDLDDVIVGAPQLNTGAGYARLLSGGGSTLATWTGRKTRDAYGAAVAGVGDVDGDGLDEVMAGAIRGGARGGDYADLISGRTWLPMHTFHGPAQNLVFASWIGGAGDVNCDGLADLILGSPLDDPAAGLDAGTVWVFHDLARFVQDQADSDGDGTDDHFGTSVAIAGDLDRDGNDDVLVGARGMGAANAGYARALSGADLTVVLHTWNGVAGHRFGQAVSGAGDLDGDGHDDVVVGAPRDDLGIPLINAGRVTALSGDTFGQLWTADGSDRDDRLGRSVAGVGDVDQDGTPDVLAGAPQIVNMTPTGRGYARLLSGRDGITVLHTWRGDLPGDSFGQAVSGAGDADLDGYPDLVVGAPFGSGGRGYARVLSGEWAAKTSQSQTPTTLEVLFDAVGDAPGDELGTAVSGAGDLDGDGHGDVVVGAPGANYARAFSGKDGSVLWTAAGSGGDRYGDSVAGAGDRNGDGFDDVIVGAPQDNIGPGYAQVLSGRDGSVLETFEGDPTETGAFGRAVAGGGDLNCDGRPDLVVGAADADTVNGNQSGSARVFTSLRRTDPGIVKTYGAACDGGTGTLPHISLDGHPWDGEPVTAELDTAPPGAGAALWLAAGRGNTPFLGCTILLDLSTLVTLPAVTVDPDGTKGLTFTLLTPGTVLDFQWLILDGGIPAFLTTEGLELTIGRKQP